MIGCSLLRHRTFSDHLLYASERKLICSAKMSERTILEYVFIEPRTQMLFFGGVDEFEARGS